MKDANGLYYHPFPQNKKVRMYVRKGRQDIEFRLWNQEDPMLWTQHGWVPYGAISQAVAMYQGSQFDPKRAYDLRVAKALLAESMAGGSLS